MENVSYQVAKKKVTIKTKIVLFQIIGMMFAITIGFIGIVNLLSWLISTKP